MASPRCTARHARGPLGLSLSCDVACPRQREACHEQHRLLTAEKPLAPSMLGKCLLWKRARRSGSISMRISLNCLVYRRHGTVALGVCSPKRKPTKKSMLVLVRCPEQADGGRMFTRTFVPEATVRVYRTKRHLSAEDERHRQTPVRRRTALQTTLEARNILFKPLINSIWSFRTPFAHTIFRISPTVPYTPRSRKETPRDGSINT